jgi:[ribosomal protein S18]-alanine N-acetyltransferase
VIADADIRLATPADAREISAMSRDLIEHELPWRWRERHILHAIDDAATNVAVLCIAKQLAAFGIMKYEDESAHLLLFAVSEKHRRLGAGSAVLRWLEAVALTAGITHFRCEVRAENAVALAFYRRHNFQQTSEVVGMYNGYVDGIRLEKGNRDSR